MSETLPAPVLPGKVPGYSTPAHLRMDPPQPGQETTAGPFLSPPAVDPATTAAGRPAVGGSLFGLGGPRRAIAGLRTSSSTGDQPPSSTRDSEPRPKADPKEAAKVAAGLIGLTVLMVGWLVEWLKPGHTVREPTDEQTMDIAKPLGRIATRHLPAEILTGDVADGISAGTATAAYLRDGDLIIPKVQNDAGVPAGLNDDDEDY